MWYFPFLIVSGYLVFVYSKASVHLYFNQFYHPFFDTFFKYITYLGDGRTMAVVGFFYFFFIRIREGLFIGTSVLLGSTITQLLKRFVFHDELRPAAYFESLGDSPLRLVDGVDLHAYFSFPSGHTTAAFALTLSLAFIYQKRWLDQLMFFMALLIGYSRVYLSQHFLDDVFVGSIVGVLATIIAYSLYYPSKSATSRLNKPVFIFKK